MGFWKEVKQSWTREGIKKSFQELGWTGWLCIFGGVVAADLLGEMIPTTNGLIKFLVYFVGWISGYAVCYFIISLISKLFKR